MFLLVLLLFGGNIPNECACQEREKKHTDNYLIDLFSRSFILSFSRSQYSNSVMLNSLCAISLLAMKGSERRGAEGRGRRGEQGEEKEGAGDLRG